MRNGVSLQPINRERARVAARNIHEAGRDSYGASHAAESITNSKSANGILMDRELRLGISYQLRQVIGDGSECMGCGDRVWLRGYAVVIFIGEREAGQYGSLVCQSCGDLISAEVEDI